jgi:bifunctional DNase/RNase
MSRMVEVVIDSVRVSLTNQQRIVVLREVNADRYLPIWIGPYEAEAITIALQEIEVARPQTPDQLKNAIQKMGGRLVRVQVVELKDDVFYGELVVELENDQVQIDCRPSDALALAVRWHVPILIAREILDTAGLTPEVDLDEKKSESDENEPEEPVEEEPAGEGRLSVFEDFLDQLDLNLPPAPDEGEEDDDDPGKLDQDDR